MKRIIDISEEEYQFLMCEKKYSHLNYYQYIIADSTPLNECEAEDCVLREEMLKEYCKQQCHSDTCKGIEQCLLVKPFIDLPSVYPKRETVTEFADRCRQCGRMNAR